MSFCTARPCVFSKTLSHKVGRFSTIFGYFYCIQCNKTFNFPQFSHNIKVFLTNSTFFGKVCCKSIFRLSLKTLFSKFLRAPPPDPRQGAAAPWTPCFAPTHTALASLACVRGCGVEKILTTIWVDAPMRFCTARLCSHNAQGVPSLGQVGHLPPPKAGRGGPIPPSFESQKSEKLREK